MRFSLRRRGGGASRGEATPATARIFFCTDVHGSDECFRKFINAGEFYDVEHLVLGGDITGKLLIPITRVRDGAYECTYGDHAERDLDEGGRRELEARIRRFGHYPVVGDREELAQLADEAHRDEVFRKVVYDAVADWVTFAEERLRGTGRRCYMAPGNDDFLEIDGALEGSDVVEFAEGRCIDLDERHEMITTGYSNPTPWDTERELPEDELEARIWGMAQEIRDMTNAIAVLHPPPHASEIDSAPQLTDDLGMQLDMSGVRTAPVGSTAVRAFIEQAQPLLGLHGHVHEGRGSVKIGRTLCINPGSEYTEGTLAGAIVHLADGAVLRHQLVSG